MEDLVNVESNKQEITQNTLKYLNDYFGKDVEPLIQQVYMKPMGHAMAIPGPGFLFNDANDKIEEQNFAFAGVDNGRLPLFFEAVDSGISAVKRLGML